MHSQQFIDEMKQKLMTAKSKLEEDLSGLPQHTEIDQDPEANADEAEIDFDNQGVRAKIEQNLKKIEIALGRIQAGTYGVDNEGNEISEERLRALPWADKSI